MLSYAFTTLNQGGYEDVATEEFENIHNLFAAILPHLGGVRRCTPIGVRGLLPGLECEKSPHSRWPFAGAAGSPPGRDGILNCVGRQRFLVSQDRFQLAISLNSTPSADGKRTQKALLGTAGDFACEEIHIRFLTAQDGYLHTPAF